MCGRISHAHLTPMRSHAVSRCPCSQPRCKRTVAMPFSHAGSHAGTPQQRRRGREHGGRPCSAPDAFREWTQPPEVGSCSCSSSSSARVAWGGGTGVASPTPLRRALEREVWARAQRQLSDTAVAEPAAALRTRRRMSMPALGSYGVAPLLPTPPATCRAAPLGGYADGSCAGGGGGDDSRFGCGGAALGAAGSAARGMAVAEAVRARDALGNEYVNQYLQMARLGRGSFGTVC